MCLTSIKPLKKRKSILPIVAYKYVNDTTNDGQCFAGPWYSSVDNKYGWVLHAKDLDYYSKGFGEYIKHLTVETHQQMGYNNEIYKVYDVNAGYHAYVYKRGQRILKNRYQGVLHFVIIPPFTEYIKNNEGNVWPKTDIVATRMIVCKDKKQLVRCYLLSLLGLNKRSRH